MMIQNGKKTVIVLIGVFTIFFFMVTALLWTPQAHAEVDMESAEILRTLSPNEITEINDCILHENGLVEFCGVDSFVIFEGISESGRMIRINFSEPLNEDTEFELYLKDIWGFNEGRKWEVDGVAGDASITFVVSDFKYNALRVDATSSYVLNNIQICQVDVQESYLSDNKMWFLIATIVALCATGLVYYLDIKRNISESVFQKGIYIYKFFRKNVISILLMGIISGGVGLFLIGKPIISVFYVYEVVVATIVSFLILSAIRVTWTYRKNLVENFEKVFVVLLLIAGIIMIILSPIGRISWDLDVHYRLSLEASYLGEPKITQTDSWIMENHQFAQVFEESVLNFTNIRVLNAQYENIITEYETNVSLAHLPSGLFMAMGRLLGLPFVFVFMLGKLGNLLTYTIICYFALKKLKSGKLILAIIALFPTNVLLACTYSYDYWVTAFSLLGMAYFIGEIQNREESISVKDIIIMCLSFVLACIPKKIYFPLLLIPFLMPKDKIKNRKKYYLICVLALVLTFSTFMKVAVGETTVGTGDLRGGNDVGPADQVAFIFGDIFGYAFILLKFLFTHYLTIANMENYITLFPYLTEGIGYGVVLLLLLLTTLYDKDVAYAKGIQSSWLSRVYVILMYFGGSALVATSMYVAFTAVGLDTIMGCQARYIVPWIYPLLSVWAMNGIKPMIQKKHLYWIATIGSFGVLFINIIMVFLPSVIDVWFI